MSSRMWCLGWPSRNDDLHPSVALNWNLINIRLGLRSMIGRVMFDFGLEGAADGREDVHRPDAARR